MPNQKPSRVIVDTNLWISFLIGKELRYLKDLIIDEKIKIITTDLLLEELTVVTSRDKLKKYFNLSDVKELVSLLAIISEKVSINSIESICRDPKDDFLLALAKESKADFLITGDKDLLAIEKHGRTEILVPKKFKERIKF